MSTQVSLTIGIFDGFHLGHRRLVQKTRQAAGAKGRSVLVTFPHPPEFYLPSEKRFSGLLYPLSERLKMAKELGIDHVEVLDFCRFRQYGPLEFLEFLFDAFHPDTIVVGPNFHFGKDRRGDIPFLTRYSRNAGARVEVVPPLMQNGQRVSSSLVRFFLQCGNFSKACEFLGAPFRFFGALERTRENPETGWLLSRNASQLLTPAQGSYLVHHEVLGRGTVHVHVDAQSAQETLWFSTEKPLSPQEREEWQGRWMELQAISFEQQHDQDLSACRGGCA